MPTNDLKFNFQGHGLLQVEGAFDYLSKFQDCQDRDIRFAVSCGNSSKGIHMRDFYEEKTREIPIKGQLISKCPFVVFKSPINPSKKFPGFLPYPLKRGQINKVV